MKRFLVTAAAVAAALPSVASAETFDFAGNFGASVFRYGAGTGGSYTTLPVTGNCVENANFPCHSSSNGSLGIADLPAIGVNTGTAPISAYTFVLPSETVFLHPGISSDAILAFVAPRDGLYTYNYNFSRLDTTNNGDGVTIGLFLNGGDYGGGSLNQNGFGLVGTGGSVVLKKGDQLTLAIGDNRDVGYDSTGLTGSVSTPSVPEPATWAMMMLGFGMIGFGLRRRSKVTTSVRFA